MLILFLEAVLSFLDEMFIYKIAYANNSRDRSEHIMLNLITNLIFTSNSSHLSYSPINILIKAFS